MGAFTGFRGRFTVFPDSGAVELHCSACGWRWTMGYHPSLDVLVAQAAEHNRQEHPVDHPLDP